jgi:aspartyl protease family protein
MEDEQPPSSDTIAIGKGMLIATWALAILLLTLFFNHWSKENKMNTKPTLLTANGIKQTIIKRNDLNQYIVEGFVNGKPVVFLLDTGATEVVIPLNVAKSLNLIHGAEGLASTAGGNVVVYDTRINELIIGNIVLHNVKASINPHMDSKEILLGMSALKKITLLQQGDNLILSITAK